MIKLRDVLGIYVIKATQTTKTMNKARTIFTIVFLTLYLPLFAIKTADFGGESFTYRIRYGLITGGEVKLKANKSGVKSEPTIHVKVDMYTTGLVDNIYHLHDIFESELRTKDGLPVRFIRDAHEGKYVRWEQVDYYDNKVESNLKGVYEVDGRYHDLISAVYALRCMDYNKMTVGRYTDIPIYYEEEIRKIRVFYQGVEEVKLNGKIYRCHKFAPVLSEVEMFEKKAPFIIWISDDKERKPVQIKVNFKVGSFKVELQE